MILLRPCISSPAWERWSVLWWRIPSCQMTAVFFSAPTALPIPPPPWTCSTSAAVSPGMGRHCTTCPSILCTLRVSSSPGCPMHSGSWLLSTWVIWMMLQKYVQFTLVRFIQSNNISWFNIWYCMRKLIRSQVRLFGGWLLHDIFGIWWEQPPFTFILSSHFVNTGVETFPRAFGPRRHDSFCRFVSSIMGMF